MLGDVTPLIAADMPRVMPYAPREAFHLILTYSHDIDLALCAAALKHDFDFCGLIGSATKWTRFHKRLSALGLDADAITCPIGDPTTGKHPDQIAAGTISDLLAHHSHDAPCLKELA
jgi:xanthine dehydrogenase accessory factor